MTTAEPNAYPAPPPDDENTPEYREWLAAAYDTDVYEQWLKPFEELLQRRIEPLSRGMALEVGCATGRGTEQLMKALGTKSRLVAQEDRGFLLDLARARMGDHVGSRLFFNSDPLPKLRYDGKVFSTVVANLSWWERTDRAALLAEMARVLDDGGMVVLTAPLAGTFAELIDLSREVAVKLDVAAKLEPRIAALEAMFSTPEEWVEEVEALGLANARVDCNEVELTFASSKELFSSTLAQARWVGLWRKAFGEDDKRLVWHIRQMIDAYWADGKFTMTVAAGCLTARRPEGFVARKTAEKPRVEEPEMPVLLAAESEADGPPQRPQTIPPARRDGYYASGDAIAAELLGLGGAPHAVEDDRTLAEEPEEVEALEPEPLAAEHTEPEPVEAEAVEEVSSAAAMDPLEEGEPYVPDEADLHSPTDPGDAPRPTLEDLDSLLDGGSGLEQDPAFSPVPLGMPQASPVAPIDLGEPQIRPVAPVDLDDPPVDLDDSIPDWERKRR
jgi:SAM-dependent methyltransferase